MAAIGGASGVFIPKIIRNEALIGLQDAQVYGNLTTRAYEVDLQEGDQVSIGIIDAVPVSDYTDYADVTHSKHEATKKTLTVDQYKGFDRMISRRDVRQGTPHMELVTAVAAAGGFALGNEVDKSVAGLHSDVTSANTAGTFKLNKTSNPDTLWTTIGSMRTKLARNKVPATTPLWCVVSPEIEERLLNDTSISLRDTPIGDTQYLNGFVGRMRGVDIYTSNNIVLASNNYKVLMGTREAIGLVIQLEDVDVFPLPNKGNRVWGISGSVLYGTDIMRDEQLVLANVDVTSTT